MSLFTIIRLLSCIYLLTSILLPEEMINLTAQFLSLIIIPVDKSSKILPHVFKSILLLVSFFVLFTILGGNAIYNFIHRNNSLANQQPTMIQQKQDDRLKKLKETAVIINNNKAAAATDNTPVIMHSSADLMLKSTHAAKKLTEPMTAIPSNNDILIESTAKEQDQLENNTIIASDNLIDEPTSTNNDKLLPQLINIESTKQKLNNDDIITIIAQPSSRVVKPILVHDQLTKYNIPTTTLASTINKHVILPTVPTAITTAKTMEQQQEKIVQPEITESTIPDSKSIEEEHHSTATKTTTITPPTEPLSDDSKEQYYSDIIKRDSNIMSFSDNLQRIFDEPPSSPIPQLNSTIIINKSSTFTHQQPSIEEIIMFTPALTPPQAGSTSSRGSSSTRSNKSTSTAFKSRLQTAMQKVVRSGPRQPLPQQQEQPQQQQTMDPTITDTIHSASLLNNKTTKPSRFSSIRLTRKKSTPDNLLLKQEPPAIEPPPPAIQVKKSVSTKLQNKFKKSSKRLSKIFS